MKRFLAFTLMAAMALTLSACESQSDNAQATRSIPEAPETSEAEEELSKVQEEFAALQTEYDSLQENLSQATEELEGLKEAKAEADSLIETLTGEKDAALGELDEVKGLLEKANADLASQEELLSQTQAMVESLQENYDTLETEYADYRHKAEGGRLVIPDDILGKYEQLAQEASAKVSQVLDEELSKLKEEAFDAVSGLLVGPDTSRDANTYDSSYFFKGAEANEPAPGSLRYEE